MKKAIGIFLMMALLLAGARPVAAMYVSTSELARSCLSKKDEEVYGCVNYIAGVIDYHILMQSLGTAPTIPFCLPKDITMSQAAIIVMTYLRSAPQHDDFIAAASVPLALNKAFPCRVPAKGGKKK